MNCKKINLILLTLSLIVGCFHSMEISINQVIQQRQQPFQTSDDFTGKTFNADLINMIKGNITTAQSMFTSSQLSNISQYLATTINKLNSTRKYSVYVYNNQTTSAAQYDGDQGQLLFWNQYGKYKLTYIIDHRNSNYCKTIGTSGASSQFGENVTKSDQDFLIEVVKNSAIYKGDNLLDAGNYIYQKLIVKYPFSFKVNVSKPSSDVGFYQCRTGQFWASFKNFTDRKWDYYILRYK